MIDPRQANLFMLFPSMIVALFGTLAEARPIHVIVDALVILTGGTPVPIH